MSILLLYGFKVLWEQISRTNLRLGKSNFCTRFDSSNTFIVMVSKNCLVEFRSGIEEGGVHSPCIQAGEHTNDILLSFFFFFFKKRYKKKTKQTNKQLFVKNEVCLEALRHEVGNAAGSER